jgi:YHS domain-containing protein
MPDLSSLADRIDAEFAAATQKVAEIQKQGVQQFEERRQRLETLEKTLDDLKGIWQPRLEALSTRFADRAKVTPSVNAGRRQATFQFQSELARIDLRFSVTTDDDVQNLIFQYDLNIVPIMMKFDSHDEIRFPVAKVNRDALASWFDDRIVSFVKTYLELHQNHYYLKDHLVEDPIAKVRFPKYAAGAKLDWNGKTVYFLGDDTRREFEKQQAAAAK